ncbi:hypothetical protein HPB50_010272 [Hyalomma asiaticum]|uniref:Uncharacterized protein n=1 Tax=Hyalomma asiaticum TaxID=266040 RepID=A0ACB7SX80_HYAAI|nr:hypothetical protein HPB50_010272 [Hyalomma asiaticum]
MPTPTLAKVKRLLSASDTTYVVSGESRHSSDLSHQRKRNGPNNNLSGGFDLLTDRPWSAYTHRDRHDSFGNNMPIASRGTAVGTNDAPRQRYPTKEEADNTSQQGETASTQSSSSVSSSSRSSCTTWSPVGNAPEKTESKESEHSARTTSRLEPMAARNDQPRNTWVKPQTVVRSSYKSKTWKYSEAGHLRHEDPSNVQEEDEEHGFIRVRDETIQLKECLLYPLAFCLLMGFILVGTFLFLPMDPSHRLTVKGFNAVCVSYGCLRDASYLNTLLSWDRVDPCVDFYAFVCDHWTSQHTASTPTSFPETFGEDYAAFLENKIYSMINNKSLESDSLQPIRQLYEKCVNLERADEEGWDSLLELLFDVSLEGFPLTPPVRSSKSVWEMAAKVLRKTGSNALFGVGIAAHPLKDVGRDFLSVELPEMLTGSDGVDINDAARLYTEAMFCALKFLKKEYLPPIHALSVVKFASDLEKLVHKTSSALYKRLKSIQVMNYLGVRLIAETSPFLPHNEIVDFKSTLLYGKRILRQINTSSHFDTDSHNAIQSLLSTVDLRILRPDWINDPALLERYIDGFPSAANRSGLQYYVESHEHTFLSSLGRSSLQRWTRPVFTTNCWVELAPPAIYVPVLASHIANAYGGSFEDEQSSRVRSRSCAVRSPFDICLRLRNGKWPSTLALRADREATAQR